MEDSIVIEAEDIVEDALNALKIGDIISVNDALHLMLLASSNIAAQALARFVGQKSIK
jgi:D-alanyl-D-alanine carboxypeptidase